MAESFVINYYQFYIFSSRDQGNSVVIGYGDGGKVVYIHFVGEQPSLPETRKIDDNRYIMYYSKVDLSNIVDMLRNEKPIYFIYMSTGTNNSRLSTGSEPVGEGELP